jgi:hypothetical protein
MCIQCMASAMTAVGAASGTRAYLATRRFTWLTRRRLRAITVVLAVAALAVSATGLSGTGSASNASASHAAGSNTPAQR